MNLDFRSVLGVVVFSQNLWEGLPKCVFEKHIIDIPDHKVEKESEKIKN